MRRWIVLLVLLALGGFVLGRVVWRDVRGADVTVAEIGVGRVVAAVYATGRVDTDQRATVRARVAAPLATLLVGPGEPVAAGVEVARQDAAALRLAAERAEGEVEAARAALAEAEDARPPQRVARPRGVAARGRVGARPRAFPRAGGAARDQAVGAGARPRAAGVGGAAGAARRRGLGVAPPCRRRPARGRRGAVDRRPLDGLPARGGRRARRRSHRARPGGAPGVRRLPGPRPARHGVAHRADRGPAHQVRRRAGSRCPPSGRRCSSTSPPPSTSSPGSSRMPWWCRATRSRGAASSAPSTSSATARAPCGRP